MKYATLSPADRATALLNERLTMCAKQSLTAADKRLARDWERFTAPAAPVANPKGLFTIIAGHQETHRLWAALVTQIEATGHAEVAFTQAIEHTENSRLPERTLDAVADALAVIRHRAAGYFVKDAAKHLHMHR